MSRLSNELEKLHKYLLDKGKQDLSEDVLTGYNEIQKMTGHGRFFNIDKEDEGENSSEEGSDEDQVETNESGFDEVSSSTDGSGESENKSDNGSTSKRDDGDESEEQDQTDDDDYNLVDDPTDDAVSKSNKHSISKIPAGDDSATKENALNKLNTFIRALQDVGVSSGALTGKQIQHVLGLKVTPRLNSPNQKSTFAASNRIR